jgi:Mg-chelatase subunit ChlD
MFCIAFATSVFVLYASRINSTFGVDANCNIVVLISDGKSTNPYETQKKIEKLREKSDFIVIGIGKCLV